MQKTVDPIDEWYSDKQLMDRWHCSKQSLNRWRDEHGFPRPTMRVGQTPFTRGSALEAWIAAQEEKGAGIALPHLSKNRPPREKADQPQS